MPVIHHIRSGTGAPALVFIHAFGCARSDWDAQVAQFSTNYETVAVDLMSELNLQACVIVGNSLGCRIALEVASRAPTRTRAVVLVDGSRLGTPGTTGHAALRAFLQSVDER